MTLNDHIVCYAVMLLGLVLLVHGQQTVDNEDPKECAQKLLDWCKNKEYSNHTMSMHVFFSSINGTTYSVSCGSTASGTECKKNNEPWYQCYPNNTVIFKGQALTEDTNDPDVCEAKKASVSSQFNRDAFDKSMDDINDAMQIIWNRMMRDFHNTFFRMGNGGRDYDYDGYNKYDIDKKPGPSTKEPDFDDEP